ncbi:hypothetical protein FRC03_001067 [Tulasnella sp. 419]|nr:hypothetical protein FRC03_001067 [Tulasnella sp. 419]
MAHRPSAAMRWLTLLFSFFYCALVSAQRNITVLDDDSRVIFSPLCSPRTTRCTGGWYTNSFGNDRRTITFGPVNGNKPSASFQFRGIAIYYYAVTSSKTATVTIQIDSEPSQTVNLTQSLGISNTDPIKYPIFAWKREGLNPGLLHTFYLQWAENDPNDFSKWAGFDFLQYTVPNGPDSQESSQIGLPATSGAPATISGTERPTQTAGVGVSATATPTSNAAVIGGAVGGTMGGIILIIIGIIFWKKRKIKQQETAISMRQQRRWDPESPGSSGLGPSQPMLGVPTPYILPNSNSSNPLLSSGVSDTLSGTTVGKAPITPAPSSGPSLPQLRPGDENNPETVALILHQQRN